MTWEKAFRLVWEGTAAATEVLGSLLLLLVWTQNSPLASYFSAVRLPILLPSSSFPRQHFRLRPKHCSQRYKEPTMTLFALNNCISTLSSYSAQAAMVQSRCSHGNLRPWWLHQSTPVRNLGDPALGLMRAHQELLLAVNTYVRRPCSRATSRRHSPAVVQDPMPSIQPFSRNPPAWILTPSYWADHAAVW